MISRPHNGHHRFATLLLARAIAAPPPPAPPPLTRIDSRLDAGALLLQAASRFKRQ